MPSEDERSAAPPPPLLTESPNSVATERTDSPEQQEEEEESSSSSPSSADSSSRQFTIVPKSQQSKASPSSTLHPYTRPLTISDLDSCVALENAAFTNPEERATREKASRGKTKFPRTPYLTCVSLGAHVLIHRTGSQLSFRYRLTQCGEICYGLFCTAVPGDGFQAETLEAARSVETSRRNGAVTVLLGHVVATRTNDATATGASMDVPEDWESPKPKPSNLGHQEAGRNIVLHSVAVLPGFQGRSIGRTMMMSYIQHINGSGIADQLSLLARDHMTRWYEKLGFTKLGNSNVQLGGGVWIDMGLQLKTLEARTAYG